MSKLPAKYQPSAPPIPAKKNLVIDEPFVTDAQLVESMRRKGAITVTENYLKDLENIGIATKNAGTLKIGRGQALLTQQKVEELSTIIMEAARREVEKKVRGKPKNPSVTTLGKYATALAQLSKASTESQRLMLEIEEAKPGGATDDDVPAVKSFQPGADVRPVTQIVANKVTINESEKKG